MDKYLGYLLPRENNNVHAMRFENPLSEDQYTEFRQFIKITSILRPYVIDFMGLDENFGAFNRLPSKMKKHFEALSNPMLEGAIGSSQRIAKSQNALSIFLFSAGAFRDRARTRLEERFGKNSPSLVAWDVAVSRAYDTHFEYRLLYNLRNFAQHHDIPLSLVPLKSILNKDSKIEAAISVVLTPNKILSSSRIQKKFVPELEKLSGQIDLNNVAKVYFKLHASFMKFIIDIHKQELADMQAYREAVEKRLDLPDGAFPVIWEGAWPLNDETTVKGNFTHFSFDEFDLILVIYEHVIKLTETI